MLETPLAGKIMLFMFISNGISFAGLISMEYEFFNQYYYFFVKFRFKKALVGVHDQRRFTLGNSTGQHFGYKLYYHASYNHIKHSSNLQ
jgi:hypothetical protein